MRPYDVSELMHVLSIVAERGELPDYVTVQEMAEMALEELLRWCEFPEGDES